jgi:fumarate reductase subunit D
MRSVRTLEPFWWFLFAGGGMIAAFLVAVHILVNLLVGIGVLSPETLSHARFGGLVANPFVTIYLLALFTLPFFHVAHRVRGVVRDLGLHADRVVATLVYGAAIVGSVVVFFILMTVP